MSRLIKIFFIGMLISALGTLPLGTLNIISMQLSVAEGYRTACYFAVGVALVEIVYVRISLVGMDWVRKRKNLFKWLDWIAILIVAGLAVASFIAATKPQASHNALISNHMNRFLFGLMLSAINPVQIPFWFGWSTVLFTKNILLPKNSNYNSYIVGIGLGTLLGNSVFIFGGKWLVSKLKASQQAINIAVGIIFVISAVIQCYRLVSEPAGKQFQVEKKK